MIKCLSVNYGLILFEQVRAQFIRTKTADHQEDCRRDILKGK